MQNEEMVQSFGPSGRLETLREEDEKTENMSNAAELISGMGHLNINSSQTHRD